MTAEALLLSVALLRILVHIKVISNEKEAPKSCFVRLQATNLEVQTTGVVFSTKASLPSPIKTDFYLNDTSPVYGSMITILLEEN